MATIAAEIESDTLATVSAMAAERGVSPERLAGDLVQQAVAEERDLAAAIAEGRRQIAAGQGLSHAEAVAEIRRWKRERTRAA